MFELSWGEIALIALVALLVVPPKDFPALMRKAGQWAARARHFGQNIQNALDHFAALPEDTEKSNAPAMTPLSAPLAAHQSKTADPKNDGPKNDGPKDNPPKDNKFAAP